MRNFNLSIFLPLENHIYNNITQDNFFCVIKEIEVKSYIFRKGLFKRLDILGLQH